MRRICILKVTPEPHWQKLWSNRPLERSNKEIRCRTDVVGVFPNRLAAGRLVGVVLAEQHDEWTEGRRCLNIPNTAGWEGHAAAQHAGSRCRNNCNEDDDDYTS